MVRHVTEQDQTVRKLRQHRKFAVEKAGCFRIRETVKDILLDVIACIAEEPVHFKRYAVSFDVNMPRISRILFYRVSVFLKDVLCPVKVFLRNEKVDIAHRAFQRRRIIDRRRGSL